MSETDLKKRKHVNGVFSRPGMGSSAQKKSTDDVKQQYEERLRKRVSTSAC